MKDLLEILDKIINTRQKTNGITNFYIIEETELKAIRELVKREIEEVQEK